MFNKAEVRKQIIQYFKSAGSGENIVQAIKEALFLNQDFNPLLLFELLSRGKQKITRDDWKKFLISRNIGFSDKQIRYFFRHCRLAEQTTLNQFLQMMIPYNADVLREFKAKYLQSLQIEEFSHEVQFIFIELMRHWIDFFRNLIEIRSQLSRTVTKRQIQHLVKQDLVLESKPRQSRKFHQLFQQSTFELSFNQIRKFLELWLSQDQINHEFYLLNVKRHIKSDDPFRRIVYRTRNKNGNRSRSRSRSRSVSASRSISNSRSVSRKKQGSGIKKRTISAGRRVLNKSQRQNYEGEPNVQLQNEYPVLRGKKQSKYDEFKKQLQHSLRKQEHNTRDNKVINASKAKKNIKANDANDNRLNNESEEDSEKQQDRRKQVLNREAIQKRGNDQKSKIRKKEVNSKDSQIILKMFQQIVLKQDRIQKLRKQLAKTSDFSINNLFKIMDRNSKGYLNSEDFAIYYDAGADNSDSIVNFYGSQRGKIKIDDFAYIFRPLSRELNERLESRQQIKQGSFKKQTSRLIYEILQLEGELHNNLNKLRMRIKQEGINPKSLFEYVDGDGKGYIASQNIKSLLEQNNIHTQPKDIKCFMKLFRKRIQQRILEKDFLNFLNF